MKYSDVRDKIKGGDIIAVSHSKWNSWYDIQIQAVRIFTESEYCHVGLVREDAGRLFVIESVTPFIRVKPLSEFIKDGFYWIPVNKPISDNELRFAMSEVGKGRYSKFQAIIAQLNMLPIGKDDKWECAEFCIVARAKSGVDLGNKATPSAVVKKLQEQGCPVYLIDKE